MNKKIEAVIFDLSGVVFTIGNAYKKTASLIGLSSAEIRMALKFHDDEACRGNFSSQEYWRNTLRTIGCRRFEDLDFQNWWAHLIDPILPTHQLIRDLQGNITLGLLTNCRGGTIERGMERGNIPRVEYGIIVDSSQVGILKPDPEIFKLTEEKLWHGRIRPEETLFVDDRSENVQVAKLLGFQGMQFMKEKPLQSVLQIRRRLEI